MSLWLWALFDYLAVSFAVSLVSLLGARSRRARGEEVKLGALGNVMWSLLWPYILYLVYVELKGKKHDK